MTSIVLRQRHFFIFAALIFIVTGSQAAAFLLRFEFGIPLAELRSLQLGMILALAVKLPIFYGTRLHRGWLNFSGLDDIRRILLSTFLGTAAFSGIVYSVLGKAFPRSIYVLDFILTVAIVCSLRVMIRSFREAKLRVSESGPLRRILIYGAGAAGVALAKEIGSNPKLCARVVGFLDDKPHLRNEIVLGIPVLGTGDDAIAVANEMKARGRVIDEIMIAIPSASREEMTRVIHCCRITGIPCKTLPSLSELLANRHLSTQIREINLDDLLSRESVQLEEGSIRSSLAGKRVLITGAAGSIGSELAARVADFSPAELILFDNAESQLFKVDFSLRSAGVKCTLKSVIGDIRDYDSVETVIQDNQVETVFHAAAYKHVPLMEVHVGEAATNNVLGTWNVAEASYRCGVKNFTLISSDKAVNPTNVMGATKRVAELIVSSYPASNGRGTKFSAVRFGNVLGSNGSVVPIFQWQILRGGPVTVTDPSVTRYFMTVREAVQLVLQASTMSKGADIFVLDMGEPVRILDLATNLIRLAGLEPNVDIMIEFTGLRPGEKLYEELIAEGENIAPTYHKKIKIFEGPVPDRREIEDWIEELCRLLATREPAAVVAHLKDLVPEYTASDLWEAGRKKPAKRMAAAVGGSMKTPAVG